MRDGDEGEAEFGALIVAQALVNIEVIAETLGKKESELPPIMPGEEM